VTEPVIVRASSTSNYPDCKRRCAAQMFPHDVKGAGYTLKQLPKSIGAHIGSGVHAGAAAMLKEKARTGKVGPAPQAVEIAIGEMRRRAEEDGVLYDDEAPNANGAESQVYRMTMSYRTHVAPRVQPIAIEERLECQVNDRLILSGQSDLIAREPGAVRDLKTGKMMGYHLPQLGSYSLLSRAHRDISIDRAFIDYVPRAPLSKPQPIPVSHEFDVATAEQVTAAIISEIDRDLVTFRHGDPERRLVPGDPRAFVANPNSRLCSAKWCGAFGSDFCPESRNKG
jgi:hypothetical protein